MGRAKSLAVALVLTMGMGGWLGAEFALGDQPAAEAAPAAESLPAARDLVRQLDADEFSQREEASRRLTELGVEGVADLAQAAQAGSLEASSRAFAILKSFVSGDNPALQQAAREALSGIAAQRAAAEKNKDDALASAAAKAQEILGSSQPKYAGQPTGAIRAPGIPFDAPPRILFPGGIPGRRIMGNRISVRVVNGTREVDVEENQDDGQKRNVKIVSDPESGIRMEVTTTKDGKSTTEKYAAKDAESLKKNHPEASQIYEQYNGAGGALQIGGGQIQIHGGRIEIGGGGIRIGPGAKLLPGGAIEADAEVEQQLQELMEKMNVMEDEALRARDERRKAFNECKRLLEQRIREGLKPGEVKPAPAAPPPAPAPAPADVQDDLFGAPAPPAK